MHEHLQRTHDPYQALRVRSYLLYFVAHVISNLGVQMQTVAVGWELYERTNTASSLALVGLVQFLPVLLFALPVGHAADRYRRKRLLLIGQSLMAASSAGLATLSLFHGPILWIYAFLFLAGASNAISMTTKGSFLPEIVSKDIFTNVVSWNSSGRQMAAMIGPALGGAVIAMTHAAFPVYLLDLLCSMLCLVLILPIKTRTIERMMEPFSLRTLTSGLHFIRKTKLILATLTLDLFAVLLGGAVTLLPIYVRDILHAGPATLGWLRSAPSIGAIVMGLAIAHVPMLKRAGPAMLWSVAGFGIATIAFGLSHNIVLSFAMLVLTGAFDTVSVVVRHTLVQVLTPDPLRGRVSAVNSIFISSSNELGGFESGIVAQFFGPVVSVVSGGIGTVLVVALVATYWPELRRLRQLAAE